MARTYGELILGYLRDCAAAGALDEKRPFYIIELGAGSGRLTHHLLHQFYPRFLASPFANLQLKFVLTDFVPEIIHFWRGHPKLQPWVAQGLLDFAQFDATAMQPLTLLESGETLTPKTVKNPLVLLANYFFDSIPQDSFVIENGELHQNLLTLYSTQPEPELDDPTIWERLSLAYEPLPLPPPYKTAVYHDMLTAYEAALPDTTFSFPALGLDCLRFWEPFGPTLWLTADRGDALLESLVGGEAPLPNLHGSFSLMVNYHALSEYVWLRDGAVLQAEHYQSNLQLLAYLLGSVPQNGLETKLAFETAVLQNGPDTFFTIRQHIEAQISSMDLAQLLAVLRWSCFDAELFRACFPVLIKQIKTADAIWHEEVQNVLLAIEQQYLPLGEGDEVERLLGELLSWVREP